MWVYWAAGITLAILALALILKARQLNVVIVDRSGGKDRPAPYRGVPPQPGGFAGFAPHDRPSDAPPRPSLALIEQSLTIAIDGIDIAVREGLVIDLEAEPALEGRGEGIRAVIVPHPRRPGVLGLRNTGDSAWTAHLRDGRDQQIDKSQNVRLAAGVRIDFGGGLVGDVRPRLT